MNPELLMQLLGTITAPRPPARRRRPSVRERMARAADDWPDRERYSVQVPFQPTRPNTMSAPTFGGKKIV
jgi:hypothetical protein